MYSEKAFRKGRNSVMKKWLALALLAIMLLTTASAQEFTGTANGFLDFNHDAYRAVIPASGNGVKTLMRGGVEFSEELDFSKLGDMMASGSEGAMPDADAGAMPDADAPAMPGSGGDMAALMAMSRPPVTVEAVDSYTSGQNVNYVRAEEG